ncbi:bacterial protein of unknown function [bacterium BMS3Bbin09]|nr:bacterial protein of unknown function [bacterium BMS3Bbin09]HDH33999.1 hypothetical protein [Nitrospirota bacterium]
MKRKISSILSLMFILVAITAFNANAETEKSASASVDLMSSYMWRGFELHEDPAIQPSVGITYGSFGMNLWSDYNTETKEATETDLTLNYTFLIDKFSFDAGYIYFGLENATDTQEIYLSAAYDMFLSPTLTVYYDFDEGDGTFIEASIGHNVAVGSDMTLSLGASASYNADSSYSIGAYNGFHSANVSAALSIPVNKEISITPMIAYSTGLSSDAKAAIKTLNTDADSDFVYGGVNLALSF